MKPNLWNSLESLSIQAALLVEWEQAMGEDLQRRGNSSVPPRNKPGPTHAESRFPVVAAIG